MWDKGAWEVVVLPNKTTGTGNRASFFYQDIALHRMNWVWVQSLAPAPQKKTESEPQSVEFDSVQIVAVKHCKLIGKSKITLQL